MRRVWLWVLLAALVLAGCQAAEDPAAEEVPPSAAEAAEPAADPALGEAAQAVYAEIAGNKTFTVTVEEPDGTLTALDITPENAWNVEGPAHLLADGYDWSPAETADWEDLVVANGRGYLLSLLSTDGAAALRCCSGGDVVELTADGETSYVRAVNPKEGQKPYEGKLYHDLVTIAEDAYSAALFSGTVDGSVTDMEEAALQLAEKVAETVRDLPGWVTWKPTDFQVSGVRVFDVYRGEPENFCCGMGFRLLVEGDSPDEMPRTHWETGSGLGEPDGDSYYGWGREVLVRKNDAGDWYCADWGTGGCSVILPISRAEEASLEALTGAFFLTEGNTHTWLLPNYILSSPAEELAKLPELLVGRTEEELQDFGAALAALYRDCPDHTDGWAAQEPLRTTLGPYAVYLDA